MIDRYADPDISALFCPEAQYGRWRAISLAFTRGLVDDERVPPEALAQAEVTPLPMVDDILREETIVGHDVVAFPNVWTGAMPDQTLARWVHYGLTSSDLVENGHHTAFNQAAHLAHTYIARIVAALTEQAAKHRETFMLGRTHGQWAEPTTWTYRVLGWMETLTAAEGYLRLAEQATRYMKRPGPVGTSAFFPPALTEGIAKSMHCQGTWPSTQVLPRSMQTAWAMAMVQAVLACEQIAMEVRLLSRSEVNEVSEGDASLRVGSSAMPHKRNPIQAENICGLARVARGLLAPVMESQTLHHDRDISHSSVERTAVVDLAHLTMTTLKKTLGLVTRLEIHDERMLMNLSDANYLPYSGILLNTFIEHQSSMTRQEAHSLVALVVHADTPDPIAELAAMVKRDGGDADGFTDLAHERCDPRWAVRHALG